MGFLKDVFGHVFSSIFSILGFIFIIGAFFAIPSGGSTSFLISLAIGLICFGIAHAFRKRS
jgi:branched-subunit amino acid permease